jgi:hypothetical protein
VTGSIGYVICKEKASRKPISTEVFYCKRNINSYSKPI